MEQHGGAENGYMIYCDGMASAGQVAALSLTTNLCAGQKMFFSGYVGNPSSQTGKADPNFIISVQGSVNGTDWDNISSYMTGDIKPSNDWYQIYFPIIRDNEEKSYVHFRVRIYNLAATFDGNDFVIDDMCIFATKPPLIAYQANTVCKEYGKEDSETHVLLRVDYQGINGEGYNNADVYYTVEQKDNNDVYSFVDMDYLRRGVHEGADESIPDTLYGQLYIPAKDYVPQDPDSVFKNMNELIAKYEATYGDYKVGYIYEILEGDIRPVQYTVHTSRMTPNNGYTVHMSASFNELMSSICGMTSNLNISNRMVLALNGDDQPETEELGLCANSTYDLSLHVKGSMYMDSVAPIDVTGSCVNDWLLYGDTADASSLARYGYKYKDIVKVIKDILRCDPMGTDNANQFAPDFASISRNEMMRIQESEHVELSEGVIAYDMIDSLVSKGFLTLYKPKMMASVISGDSVQYVIFPILGTGSNELDNTHVDVCTNPIFIKLKPERGSAVPLMVGGLHRDSTEMSQPVEVLATEAAANSEFLLRVDSIRNLVGIHSVVLRSTDDPNFREGIHSLSLVPDINYPTENYYVKGDSILLRAAKTNNYRMRAGYNYTYNIVMQTFGESLTDQFGCEVGVVPFTLSIVPDYLRWEPKNPEDNRWNNPDNWIGITKDNVPIRLDAHYAPLAVTHVLIPKMENGLPYPELPEMPLAWKDSIQKVGFEYNNCTSIHVQAGAAIGQQQRMDYESVVVDMSTPKNKWALRAAPVEGMLSGDLFMAESELRGETPLWEVGEFDASGRNYSTGNATFYLSLYNKDAIRQSNGPTIDTIKTEAADWSKVTNALSLSLQPAQGWAVLSRTKSEDDAVVRLPKNDDIYYYYTKSGDKVWDLYEFNLRALRAKNASEAGKAGKLAFFPGKDATNQKYTLSNGIASTTFVFGNPTMGYIDIWGFIADNKDNLEAEIGYIGTDGQYYTITLAALTEPDAITSPTRYLPPMHAIVVKKKGDAATALNVTVNTIRIVTDADQIVRTSFEPSPVKRSPAGVSKGVMTVTATNAVSSRCDTRLLLGQGYHPEIIKGEDALLNTINIDNYSATSAPATPFNIYAVEGTNGLSIDLRDEILYVPISFYMSDLPYAPLTTLWFTGVNNVDGPLVLYDALSDTERPIIDGISLDIETPEENHEIRYYIRRPGYKPENETDKPVPTAIEYNAADEEKAVKFVKDGHVFIKRNGKVYTIIGQKIQ